MWSLTMAPFKLLVLYLFLAFCSPAYSQSQCNEYLKLVEQQHLKYPNIFTKAETEDEIRHLKKEGLEDFEFFLKTITKDKIGPLLKSLHEGVKSAEESGAPGEVEKVQYSICIVQAAYKQANNSIGQRNFSNTNAQNRKPQTISAGPVSVMLIPTNNPVGKCYDIAYENRGDKHVDIFVKFTLTNNKTGEKGMSDWFGDNTQFDGLFGSANINKVNPRTPANSTRTGLYGGWLLAQGPFKFNNAPADYYGFDTVVESCNDITAEIPAGGLKWNENAYQRHYDACKSPIKRDRPIGC
jgi:hypothetical protein